MSQHPRRPKPRRAVNGGPQSDVARARRELYAQSLRRISDAQAEGFHLEAVTLIESLLADRLEARLAMKHDQAPEKRTFSTLGALADELSGEKSGESVSAKGLYAEVKAWASQRNQALHELAKLAEGASADWDGKYAKAGETARTGLDLFRRLSRAVGVLNRPRKAPVAPARQS